MLALINELTDLPGWQHKVFDSDFTFRWKCKNVTSDSDITQSMVDWVFYTKSSMCVGKTNAM